MLDSRFAGFKFCWIRDLLDSIFAGVKICWIRPLVAKCWDLSDAYKQVPLSDNAFELDSYLAVYDPSSKGAKIFKQRVLPFGSIASVTAFLRVSLAIWKIGSSLLKLMWSAYFDDFLCLARESEAKHVDFCVSSIFSL